ISFREQVITDGLQGHGVRVRYTELGAKYVGTFTPEKPVGTLHDCTAMAYRGKAIGYRIHMGDDKMKLMAFEFATPNLAPITNFLSKPCDSEIGDCTLVDQIDVVDGKAICCAPDETHQKGTTLCCPSGQSYSKLGDTERCCPDGKNLSMSANGALGCCPKGEHFEKNEGDVGYCCPDGQHLERSKDGNHGCCGDGYVLKGFYKGIEKCCKADSTFYQDSGLCCGPGFHQSITADGYTTCCRKGLRAYRTSSGEYGCCRENAVCT
uniref:Ephrin_rec_like domain-containing protein n=1 Tax=Steinernema glaseri TaxID=37863 RepID=A0A1I7Y4F5_9BILA